MATNAKDFSPVPLSKFTADQAVLADIYLKINDKFIKYKHAGDMIDGEKFNFFISKSLTTVYVLNEDLDKVTTWLVKVQDIEIQEMVDEVGEEHREVVEKREEIKEKVFDTFADLELNEGTVEILQGHAEEFVTNFTENKVPRAILTMLTKQNESIADHSVNVANISIFFAMVLGHGHSFVLENIYMGGLLHDYAKAKIPAKVLASPQNTLYSQALQDHPLKGARMAKKISGVKEQVLSIIHQHHEQFNGKGYPRGLEGDQIYELAQIVGMANAFDGILIDNRKKPKKERFKLAIKYLEYDKGKMFNPEMVQKVVDALYLAKFKNLDKRDDD